jgi:hypothetical protein
MLVPVLSVFSPGTAASDGDTPVTRRNPSPRADESALAWSLLGTLGLTFGVVSACGWSIRRHQRRSGREAALIADLIHEAADPVGQARLSPDNNPGSFNKPAGSVPPWERPGDWWRRQDFHQD